MLMERTGNQTTKSWWDGVLTAYINAAMRRVVIEKVDDDQAHVGTTPRVSDTQKVQFFGTIPELEGLYGVGDTEASCIADVASALQDWIVLGLRLGHTLPPLDDVDLNPKLEEE